MISDCGSTHSRENYFHHDQAVAEIKLLGKWMIKEWQLEKTQVTLNYTPVEQVLWKADNRREKKNRRDFSVYCIVLRKTVFNINKF